MRDMKLARTITLGLLLLFTLACFGLPLAAMIVKSLEPVQARSDTSAPVSRAPGSAFADAWSSPVADFPLYLHNSAVIALFATVGMVISSAIVAYGFSRLRWKHRDSLFVVVLATLMVPFPVVMAPLYLVFRSLGWIGTFLPLIVPAWFGGAFSIYLLRQFFLTIPRELDEAARIDGCSEFGVFVRIILPASLPVLGVVAVLQVVASWNDFLGPLLFLNHQDTYPVSLGLHMYQSQHGGAEWNVTMAATLIAIAPVLLLFVIARRAFMSGTATNTQGLNE
jgi:multiple sugar transport system permease protein